MKTLGTKGIFLNFAIVVWLAQYVVVGKDSVTGGLAFIVLLEVSLLIFVVSCIFLVIGLTRSKESLFRNLPSPKEKFKSARLIALVLSFAFYLFFFATVFFQ